VDIRSALRRGAGAGGRGGGRGGITGEPVPLDSSDPRFGDYLERVRRAIQDKMVFPPCVRDPVTRRCELLDARLVLVFGILKSGHLQFADVVVSSGPPVYDEYSERAIRLAAPFPPVPPAIMATLPAGSAGMPIRATFVYTVQTSIFSVIR
jgi:hypothetical protein